MKHSSAEAILETWPRLVRVAVAALSVLLVAFYLAQGARLSPNHVDEGLLLGYLALLADGGRPYHDFLDVYGLLSWPLPALAFELAGQEVWGVRIYVLLIKLACVVTCFGLVRRLSGLWPAALSALWLTLWLGLRWQLLQAPYAFMPALWLSLGAWLCLLCGPFGNARRNRVAGAVLIGCTLCVKLNAGAFLLAGALLHAFYVRGLPAAGVAGARAMSPNARRAWATLQAAGLVAVLALFAAFVRPHFQAAYWLYLVWPLLMALGCAWRERVAPEEAPDRALQALEMLGVSVLTTIAVLSAIIGPAALSPYLRDTALLLGHLQYASPLPALGVPGRYVGFNEHYWMQLPWLVTFVIHAALVCARRGGRMTPAIAGVAILFAFNLFTLYSRSDESHVHQASLLGIPALFVALASLQQGLPARGWRGWAVPVVAVALSVGAVGSLGGALSTSILHAEPGDYGVPALRYLKFREVRDPYVRPFSANLSDRDWDQAFDQTARVVDRLTSPGEEVLLLSRDELLPVAAGARPVGGRYRYLYYLVRNGHLDRAGFEALAPPGLLQELLADPPRVMLGAHGADELTDAFPEIRKLRDERYMRIAKFRLYFVYVQRGTHL